MKNNEIIEAAGVGYIPKNKREANDPRYQMAMTNDVKPGEDSKQAAKWGFKVGAGGKVPKLRADGKVSEDKINELTPYRQNPMYQYTQQRFTPAQMKNRVKREDAFFDFKYFMKDHGFKFISHGAFGAVFAHPNYPWVFKLFSFDDAYKAFLDYTIKNQNNPNVPKVKGRPIRINNKTYAIRLEKLSKAGNIDKKLKTIFEDSIGMTGKEALEEMTPEELTYLQTKYPGIMDIYKFYAKRSQQYVFDIHSANVMKRSDGTIVVIDPTYNRKNL